MSSGGGHYDKSCPECAAPGVAVKATTGPNAGVVVDLRCPNCAHTWQVTLANRRDA